MGMDDAAPQTPAYEALMFSPQASVRLLLLGRPRLSWTRIHGCSAGLVGVVCYGLGGPEEARMLFVCRDAIAVKQQIDGSVLVLDDAGHQQRFGGAAASVLAFCREPRGR